MPTECSADLFGFAAVEGREVVGAFDGGAITSDAGALLLGAADRAIKLTDRFAACFDDTRCQYLIEHEVVTLLTQRVFGIALLQEKGFPPPDARLIMGGLALWSIVGKVGFGALTDRMPARLVATSAFVLEAIGTVETKSAGGGERRQKELAKGVFRYIRRRPVAARQRITITNIMF